MAKNRMSDLRNHLFEVLEALKDTDSPMELDRAKVASEVAQTIINSAKAEIDLLRVIGRNESSDFFETERMSEVPARRDGGVPREQSKRLA